VTVDLPPAAYYPISVRLIMAPFVALLFAYVRAAVEGSVPVIAFRCGLFPEQALQYDKEQTKAFVYRSQSRADELPLDMIEGITLPYKSGLKEVGIDNAQELAEANLVEAAVWTPFKPPVLVE
jgi:hypothetical protein